MMQLPTLTFAIFGGGQFGVTAYPQHSSQTLGATGKSTISPVSNKLISTIPINNSNTSEILTQYYFSRLKKRDNFRRDKGNRGTAKLVASALFGSCANLFPLLIASSFLMAGATSLVASRLIGRVAKKFNPLSFLIENQSQFLSKEKTKWPISNRLLLKKRCRSDRSLKDRFFFNDRLDPLGGVGNEHSLTHPFSKGSPLLNKQRSIYLISQWKLGPYKLDLKNHYW